MIVATLNPEVEAFYRTGPGGVTRFIFDTVEQAAVEHAMRLLGYTSHDYHLSMWGDKE